MSARLARLFPMMLKHEGIWEGTYTHLDADGNILDQHKSSVECVFPKEGEVVYIQKNKFSWDNGTSYVSEFSGIIKDEKLFWDTDTFVGYGWESEGCVLLKLDRKDDPGAHFIEIIILGENANHRVRTWHWFKNGICFKRTLCKESRVS